MGFSWSPFICQALSMLLAKVAIVNCGYTAHSPTPDVDDLPPFWIVEDKNGKVVAFIVFWYANALVIAVNKFV